MGSGGASLGHRLHFPSGLEVVLQTERGRGVGALPPAPSGPHNPSSPPSPGAFLPGRGTQVRDAARSSHFGKCQARAAPGLLSTPAAPPSTPGSSSSSTPRVGRAGSGSPGAPAPAATGALEKAVRAGARHAGPELPAAASALEPPDHP
ncbi:unnamed protein product [Rangifer tarandus platyrhynchus]|uniref:Uncharacterized protein n=2 Tax=Rangifer tarandus platyrhynchus TaxID=3082113 RepID=A0ABN8YG89_RANTA|nr:unnamed protein product [Rangifer tarandus platyrhynchus]